MNAPIGRCWHCMGKFSAMRPPSGQEFWFSEIEIEPGRKVKVHKCCIEPALESVRHLTARPPDVKEYSGVEIVVPIGDKWR